MTKKISRFSLPRRYISAATVLVLYPGLPLDSLPKQDDKYDAIAAFDLARTLNLEPHRNETEEIDLHIDASAPTKPEPKITPADVFIVNDKEYFSTRITAWRTGYTPDHLRQLITKRESEIAFVRHDIPNGLKQAIFFDVDTVLEYKDTHS